MLYWNANFQIPNSGVQAKDVYVVVVENRADFYADKELKNLLFSKDYIFPAGVNPIDHLLSLPEFENYQKIN